MQRCAIAFVLGCIFVPSVAGSTSQPALRTNAAVQSRIIAAVEKDRRVYGGRTPIPGVLVGVWDRNGASFVRAFGYADLATKRALTAADHFRIGSNTKTFVVAVILQLAKEKKLSLDEPVSRFRLGLNIPSADKITVRDLCNMRSGLFEAFNTPQFARLNMTVPNNFNSRMLVAWAAKQKPYFGPGKGYHYSNTNYLLLGLIIEHITKDTVGNQIRRRLLQPFGLAQTSYPKTQAMPDPWTHGYELDKTRNWKDVSNTIPVVFMGSAGEMISDAMDIKRWMPLFATGKTGVPGGYRPATECKQFLGNTAFGLGLTCSGGWYGYTGALPGYNTADYYNPATGMTIVAWINYQAAGPPEGVASVIVRDIARVITPANVPFVYTKQQLQASGL